jgi:integrase
MSHSNDLDRSMRPEPDRITIMSGKDSRPRSRAESDEEARRVANEEIERYMLSHGHVKTVPSEASKPLVGIPVIPNAAQNEPIKSSTSRRKKKPVHVIPQEEEIERFFKVIDSPRDRAIFRLMYHAGLRASEIGLLQMRDYQPRTDRLMVTRLKGSNSGEHSLNRKESKDLKAWLKVRGMQPGAIFPSRKRGPISRKTLDELVKVYGERAGWPVKMRHCHIFKHACCTHLLSLNFNVEQVRDWVGHENIQNTMIYANVTNSRRDEMAKALTDW